MLGSCHVACTPFILALSSSDLLYLCDTSDSKNEVQLRNKGTKHAHPRGQRCVVQNGIGPSLLCCFARTHIKQYRKGHPTITVALAAGRKGKATSAPKNALSKCQKGAAKNVLISAAENSKHTGTAAMVLFGL